jgi:secreted PhoX family phosphatase
VESTGRSRGDGFAWPDNISVTPWGDLIVCQDRRGQAYLWTVRGDGEVAPIARNVLNRTEFAGACFSPDGEVLFVNLFGGSTPGSGMTCAIWGPWERGPL